MVTKSDIAELLGDMNSIAEAFSSAKLKTQAEFVRAVRGLLRYYFQEHPLPEPTPIFPVVRLKQIGGGRIKPNVGLDKNGSE